MEDINSQTNIGCFNDADFGYNKGVCRLLPLPLRVGLVSVIEEHWNELEAVRLIRDAGALVARLEAGGVKMTHRELYHARIVEAHETRDMGAYRSALNGYVEAARAAVRREEVLQRRARRDKRNS